MLRNQVFQLLVRGTPLPLQTKRCLTQGRLYKQKKRTIFPSVLPEQPTVILFPGQGSQYVGMAKAYVDIPEAKELFDIASNILKYDLLKLCNEGPAKELNKTIHCQPAIMVSSLAALELLKKERPDAIESCIGTAGFSLGEITALTFAGAIPFDASVNLVRQRAQLMQAACDTHKGGMATIMTSSSSKLRLACKKAREWAMDIGDQIPDAQIANYLFSTCKVVSGSEEGLRYIQSNLDTYNLKRMIPIPTYGAFHSHLMQSAVDPFAKALGNIFIEMPAVDVYSNIKAKPYANATEILKLLPKQIVQPVKWEQTMTILYDFKEHTNEYPTTYVCGPGQALVNILKQINGQASKSVVKIGE